MKRNTECLLKISLLILVLKSRDRNLMLETMMISTDGP